MTTISSVQAQEQYVEEQKRKQVKFGLTTGAAFVRGIRDLGYKSTATALDELIDNAEQANAGNVHVVFGFGDRSEKKPSQIAVIDDGHGMIPDMVRLAMTWGGTHREGDRSGFGRYGYGLPSACVGMGRRFTVYSRQTPGDFFAVTLDVDDISAGQYTNDGGDIIIPEPARAQLPEFVEDHFRNNFPGGVPDSSTVVLIEKLDKLTWKTAPALQEHLLRHFGVVYHKQRGNLDIHVNEKRVEAIDPLFLTPGYRWYDLDEDRATALDPIYIDVKNPETREIEGQITVRLAWLPPSFPSKDKRRGATGKNANERFGVMKDYHGMVFARMGRIIDVVTRNPEVTFVNYDRFHRIEIDFPASVDEEFNVTTSKQQVVPSDRVWDLLVHAGVFKALEQMRRKSDEARAKMRNDAEQDKLKKRQSEGAMEETAKMKSRLSADQVAKKQALGEKSLSQEAERRSRETGVPAEKIRKELEFELHDRLYKVATESMPGAPFFRVDVFGGTTMLFLNTAHRFYKEVHSGPNSTPEMRAALEVLLFSIGDRILETTDSLRDVYMHENS